MRVFLFSLLSLSFGFAHSAPQGYNYQSQLGESDLSHEQYQLVQEYLQHQQQQQSEPRIVSQHQHQQLEQQSQSVVNNGGSYQYANQLQQFEQQHQHQQQQQQVQNIVAIKPVQIETPVRHQEEPIQVFQQPPSQSQLLYQQLAQPQQSQQPQQAQYNKEFYYLSAPQDDYVEPKDLQDQLTALKKNLRVVFIKAPEHNGLADAAAKLIKQSDEQQTKIYVLTKQHDASNLASKLNQLKSHSKSPKPEVIFIKYRTPQEAEQAQRTIQEQYQALDGPNHYNYGGVAQTHDFVDNNGIDPRTPASSSSSSASSVATAEVSPIGEYLPATKKK